MKKWVSTVRRALGEAHDGYKVAAETIVAQMQADRKLTQKQVAKAISRSEAWVSRLLLWHREGCQEGTVFGPEIAARRLKVATSQLSDPPSAGRHLPKDRPDVEPPLEYAGYKIDGSPTGPPPISVGEPYWVVLTALTASRNFEKAMKPVKREALLAGGRWKADRKFRLMIRRLIASLGKCFSVTEVALNELGEIKKNIARSSDFEDAA